MREMVVLERAFDRVSGRIHEQIHNRATRRLPELVRDLIDEALARWAANNWLTFDKAEVNCSSQLYRWMTEVCRSDSRFFMFQVSIEHVLLTPEMLNGLESVTGAARPDFRLSLRGGGVLLEAKRLTDTAKFSRPYVAEGMARFVSSSYGADDSLGIMVGYVQDRAGPSLHSRVNGYVKTHHLMGVGHELRLSVSDTDWEWFSSSHERKSGLPIHLNHVWIRLP